MKLIAEVRRKPNEITDVLQQLEHFHKLGADMLSVNTSQPHGDVTWLKTVRCNTSLRVINRGFVKTVDEVKMIADYGVEYILYMMDLYTQRELEDLAYATTRNGMIPILDISNRINLEIAPWIDTSYLMINNEDRKGNIQLTNMLDLSQQIPDSLVLITTGGFTEKLFNDNNFKAYLKTSPFDYMLLHDLLHSKSAEEIVKCLKQK